MKKGIILLTACVLVGLASFSQKQTESLQQLWLAYFNQTRFSDKWGLWADFHLRTKDDFVDELQTGIARVGLTYYLNDNTKLTAGYAYVNHFPADNHANVSRPEHRPWQQIQWHTKYPKIRMMQYIRLEQRFRRKILNSDELAEGYNFNHRVRYNFFLAAPLSKKQFAKGSFAWVVNDELHIAFGKEVVYNYFDQNRFFTGLSYQTSASNSLQFGYMNVFSQLAAGNRYRSVHAARIYFLQNIDLRPKTVTIPKP